MSPDPAYALTRPERPTRAQQIAAEARCRIAWRLEQMRREHAAEELRIAMERAYVEVRR
jgi:hypothetical protein